MNKVVLVGNICRDPEYRQTQSGVSCCSFTIAVNRRFVNQSTGQRESDFINCVSWRQTADFVHKYFIKGNKIGVVGSLQTRSYDAQDGQKRFVTEVLVDEAEFVTPRGAQADKPAQTAQGTPDANGFVEVDPGDELPF